ncbi:MAG: hypothetical protein V7L20_01455 [Nostoc sp.]
MIIAPEKKFAKSQQKQYLPTQGNNAAPVNLSEQKYFKPSNIDAITQSNAI